VIAAKSRKANALTGRADNRNLADAIGCKRRIVIAQIVAQI
jgi:hypothetical protein